MVCFYCFHFTCRQLDYNHELDEISCAQGAGFYMPISPRLGPEAVAANMADYKPRYKPQEALLEANRCLFCFDAPCIQACPTGIDIPSFIKKIANGNLTGAARTILTANILGASCARVCPTQVLCEGACVVLDREGDPAGIDIRSFIKKIANGNLTGAARTILTANILGASCAREISVGDFFDE